MAKRRQRRRREKEQRHTVAPTTAGHDTGRVPLLAYTREQAAQALGVSVATVDRRVVPAIATVKTEWGARLLPVAELERYLAERREEPRIQWRQSSSGRRPAVPPEVVARIRRDRSDGTSFGEIARWLNREGVPPGQGGRQWWPSTVRAVLLRSAPPSYAASGGSEVL